MKLLTSKFAKQDSVYGSTACNDDCHIVWLGGGICEPADTRSNRFTLNPWNHGWNLPINWNKDETYTVFVLMGRNWYRTLLLVIEWTMDMFRILEHYSVRRYGLEVWAAWDCRQPRRGDLRRDGADNGGKTWVCCWLSNFSSLKCEMWSTGLVWTVTSPFPIDD